MSTNYKTTGSHHLFGEQFRLEKLSKQGDPLEQLNKAITWDIFSSSLEKMLNTDKESNAGAKPYDPMLMFKILILQRYYNLSDEQIEYQILDRLSFCRFLGLTLSDKVPDEKTVWDFKERLIAQGLEQELFDQFRDLLEVNGLIAHEGKIVDASFVETPKQRNTREENAKIKAGEPVTEWDENSNKKRQKDTDARWTKKNNQTFYGYKDHIKVDSKHKLIDTYTVTPSCTHDSQALDDLLTESDEGQSLWADSAYTGEDLEHTIKEYKMTNKVHEKGYKNKPLTEVQKKSNRKKSTVRVRVEHVFGFMENSMNKLLINSIGINRAKGTIGLINLTYNLARYEQISRLYGKHISSWQ